MNPYEPARTTADAAPQTDLLGLSRAELAAVLAPHVDRPFRAEQIYRAIHHRAVADFGAITELGQELRSTLAARFTLDGPAIAERQAAGDGTVKYLLRLADGATIEAVDIDMTTPAWQRGPTPPEETDDEEAVAERHTLCVSSQAGCALACSFCVTGYWGAGRNLTAGEIVGQVLAIRRAQATSGNAAHGFNLVFMGMGEPLLNLEALRAALEILSETVSWRRITVSTAGVIPGIEELASWPKRPNLAISLHAPDEERRSEVMPINRTHPLRELLATLRRYPLERGRRLTFEYVLIRGFNDALADADAVASRLRGLHAKVNLIPINPDPVLGSRMVPPEPAAVNAFRDRLESRGMLTTIRHRRGDDVAAACGQLRAFGRDPRTFKGRNV